MSVSKVMAATKKSAAEIIKALYEFGNNSLPEGIKRLYKEGLKKGWISGVVTGVITTAGATITARKIKQVKIAPKAKKKMFQVNSIYSSEDGLELNIGDQVEVLEENGQKLLIRKVGADNETYVVPRSIFV